MFTQNTFLLTHRGFSNRDFYPWNAYTQTMMIRNQWNYPMTNAFPSSWYLFCNTNDTDIWIVQFKIHNGIYEIYKNTCYTKFIGDHYTKDILFGWRYDCRGQTVFFDGQHYLWKSSNGSGVKSAYLLSIWSRPFSQ